MSNVCPKCGQGQMGGPSYCDGSARMNQAGMRFGQCPMREHLHRSCSTCHYRSAEDCVDVKLVFYVEPKDNKL